MAPLNLDPAGRVARAMPGTLHELSERTGYPPSEIMRQIGRLRATGRRVNARQGEKFIDDIGRHYGPTVYERVDV